MKTLVSIKNLKVTLGDRKILDGITSDVPKGEMVAIVGGSGSGKTTLALAILGLLPSAMYLSAGEVIFNGVSMGALTAQEMRQYRGRNIGMIFQEAAFDPLFTIGQQLEEVLQAHSDLDKQKRQARILEALHEVQLTDPKKVYQSYPHQLSGGMRQRVMVAGAIICNPALIIADEPTSNLDVVLQIKIMELLKRLQCQHRSILIISHDLGLIGRYANHVVVLHQGRIVEAGDAKQVMLKPVHPYTQALLEAY